MTLRRLCLVLMVLATVYVTGLAGCASLTAGADWEAIPLHSPLPAVVVVVEANQVASLCGTYSSNFKAGLRTHGCAIRDYALNVCTIYVGPDPQPSLIGHELFHCAGFDHETPGQPRR